MIQSRALLILKTGVNVFLTGDPGSGKTHTINEYVAYLRAQGVEPAITASTGIAATHIGGMTIHSWSGIGIKTRLDKSDVDKISSTKYIVNRIRRTKVLIIDEVSMLPPETLSMVDIICRKIKKSSDPFGGIQVVLVGDFFQLPPIIKTEEINNSQTIFDKEPPARFAYDSPVWKQMNPTVCYLEEQYRQDDDNFLTLLSAIRNNTFGDEHLSYIESRRIDCHSVPNTAPKLFSLNVDVNRVNDKILAGLSGESKVFTMFSQGLEVLASMLKKGCLSPEMLHLKIGSVVMFTKNNLKEGFVNGTLGIIEGFGEHNDYPIVKTRAGRKIEVEPMDWTIEENGKVRARITQLPLRLAWAITVHKSQGMSLDEAVMDLSNVFEFGQGYVALSRVRRLSGLYILGWNDRAFQVHPEVLERDVQFHSQSEQTARTFDGIAKDKIETMQKQFIHLCGGEIVLKKSIGEQKTSIIKSREKHPNAYSPWDEIQDEELIELFIKGSSIASLAKAFERTRGAIKSRLARLGILDD